MTTIIEGESLFNDGTGVVIFGIILELISMNKLDLLSGIASFLFVAGFGILMGLVAGYVAYRVLKQIDDRFIEVSITIVVAYGIFIISEMIHISGIIACVTAGLIIGNQKIFAMTPSTRIALRNFWDILIFTINSLLFLGMGLKIADVEFRGYEMVNIFCIGIIAIIIALVGRAFAVYPLCHLLNKFGENIKSDWMHVIFWGGLRGSIPLALVIGLPIDFPYHDDILIMTFSVVLFSLTIQSFSMEFLVHHLKLMKKRDDEIVYEEMIGKMLAHRAALKDLKRMYIRGEISRETYLKVRGEYIIRIKKLSETFREFLKKAKRIEEEQEHYARQKAILAEKSAIRRAYIRGIITKDVADKLSEGLDAMFDAKKY